MKAFVWSQSRKPGNFVLPVGGEGPPVEKMGPHQHSVDSSCSSNTTVKAHSIWEVSEVSKIMKVQHRIKIWNYLARHFDTEHAEKDNSVESLVPFEVLNAPRKAIGELRERFVLSTTKVVRRQESERGDTTKLLIECHDGHQIETVVMRHSNYSTVCVSSQVGCKMGCKFCATGTVAVTREIQLTPCTPMVQCLLS